MDRLESVFRPRHALGLGDADGLRASKFKHAVQGLNCDSDLGRTMAVSLRTQRIPDHVFEAADGGLHQSPTRVPASEGLSTSPSPRGACGGLRHCILNRDASAGLSAGEDHPAEAGYTNAKQLQFT
jgi:hypothetical protein